MSLNYQQVQVQVRKLGENAPLREQRLKDLRKQARGLLKAHAQDLERLRNKVALATRSDPTLRCALPVDEALNAAFGAPALPAQAIILAADGSQIAPNRHAEVEYCLVNVGVVRLCLGQPEPPTTLVESELLYDDQLYTETGTLVDVALLRDLKERALLASLAEQVEGPVITLTDGPMELWGAKDEDGGSFTGRLTEYQKALRRLAQAEAATAGYVDKPAANLVLRLLEIALLPEESFKEVRKLHPLHGVTDRDLYVDLLQPGERSAVFAMQSKSAAEYVGEIALHFFYINVGREARPWLARVEIPRWVAENCDLLGQVHATLVDQCRVMGSRPYPYLLHRAHETAVVTFEEQDQVTQMIAQEMWRRGLPVGDVSQKQALKDLQGRTAYGR